MDNSNGWQLLRKSKVLVVTIVFLALMCDSMLLTLVDPILPAILEKIDGNSTDSFDVKNINNNGKYGFLVAAKGAAQFVCNPFVGLLVSRFGYRKLMFVGDILLMLSCVAFSYGQTYNQLLIIRIAQGVSSSVTAVTGMGLLAATFTDDEERGTYMGVAIGGLSLGIIAGPVYGSILYQFVGEKFPFQLLALIVAVALVLQALNLQSDGQGKDHSMKSILRLIADPLILVSAGNMFLLNLDVSVILAFLPIRLLEFSQAPTWQLGIVVLPTSVGYLVASLVVPRTVRFLPRWLCAMCGLVLSSGTLVGLAFCETLVTMMIVTTFLGTAVGMISVSMQPIFALLVDLRHSSVYGNVYALSDMSVCLAMTIGPLVGGPILYAIGFKWMVLGVAGINLMYSVCTISLRSVRSPDDSPGVSSVENYGRETEHTEATETTRILSTEGRHYSEGSVSGTS